MSPKKSWLLCKVPGCVSQASPLAETCTVHSTKRKKANRQAHLGLEGPTDTHELDVAGIVGAVPSTHPCAHGDCQQPALIGRIYCSDRCRVRARTHGAAKLMVSGVFATIEEHAARIGIPRGTFTARISRGWSPEEALVPHGS